MGIKQLWYSDYGCSFVAKLSWKKNYFWKNICIFYKIHIICGKKEVFIWEKSFILKIFFTEKNFFYREKYKWKCEKHVPHLKNISLYRKCLCYKQNKNLS